MSEEKLHKQKFEIAQWPTSKVILYPTQATISRSIQGVQLKPGLNEIIIPDLTSKADPDSIRVSGTTDGHPARINDLTIDLIPNKYAHLSISFDFESESEDEEPDEDPPSLTAARAECDRIDLERKVVEERESAARQELSYIESFTNSMSMADKADPSTMKSALELYTTQRKAHFETMNKCTEQLDALGKEASNARKALEKELKKLERATRVKVDAKERKKIEREEKQREKKENKPEKLTQVYRVRITIDLPTGEDAKTSDVLQEASLDLTYTTSSASWTPHYDLRLDTTNPPLSTLTYRAHFTNRTFETWSNARITLSTSQASFGGLNEKIPHMEAWRVTLCKKYPYSDGESGLYSLAEKQATKDAQKAFISEDRRAVQQQRVDQQDAPAHRGIVESSRVGAAPSAPLYGASDFSKARFRSGGAAPQGAPQSSTDEKERNADDITLAPSGNVIAHSTAGLDTYGFTTTYDLPTPRTIPSSPLVRRHVIAEVPLPSLIFTHIIIPKLKAAAFLKAKLTNTSNIPLLPGLAGLTLDGSFLGNLSFPRASPEEMVVLELGVDQSLKVEYERPTMKHSTQGMMPFGKEEVGMYKRMMRLTNTKSASVSVVVLDQVPVPEDEKLKVMILVPNGLREENDVVKNGVGVDGKVNAGKKRQISVEQSSSATATATSPKLEDIPENASLSGSVRRSSLFTKRAPSPGKSVPAGPASTPAPGGTLTSKSSWGRAKATLRKNGVVRWDVDILKGGCVALALEWECKMPNGEGIQALS